MWPGPPPPRLSEAETASRADVTRGVHLATSRPAHRPPLPGPEQGRPASSPSPAQDTSLPSPPARRIPPRPGRSRARHSPANPRRRHLRALQAPSSRPGLTSSPPPPSSPSPTSLPRSRHHRRDIARSPSASGHHHLRLLGQRFSGQVLEVPWVPSRRLSGPVSSPAPRTPPSSPACPTPSSPASARTPSSSSRSSDDAALSSSRRPGSTSTASRSRDPYVEVLRPSSDRVSSCLTTSRTFRPCRSVSMPIGGREMIGDMLNIR